VGCDVGGLIVAEGACDSFRVLQCSRSKRENPNTQCYPKARSMAYMRSTSLLVVLGERGERCQLPRDVVLGASFLEADPDSIFAKPIMFQPRQPSTF